MSRTIGTWHYLFIAVLALATGSESLPERMARAYESGLHRLFAEEHWPAEVESDVAELRAQLQRVAPIDQPGVRLDVVTAAIRDGDPELIRSIARRVVLLYRKLVEQGVT